MALSVRAESSPFKFEGTWGSPVENIQNMNAPAASFLPYNPVIVEIGANEGTGTRGLASGFPYGKVIAFEPRSEAYSRLMENVRSFKNASTINCAVSAVNGAVSLWGSGPSASLIRSQESEARVEVSSIALTHWCKLNGIDHIDFLRLDVGNLAHHVLQSSSEILQTVLVVVVRTYLFHPENSEFSYPSIKKFMEHQGFELLAHWYEEGKEGEAMFVRKYLHDSIFR